MRSAVRRLPRGMMMAAFLVLRLTSGARADVSPSLAAEQWREYQAVEPKSIIELQPFRITSRIAIGGTPQSTATLIDINPGINAWFVLTVGGASYHLENPRPQSQDIALDASYPLGLRITVQGRSIDCPLWAQGRPDELEAARRSSLPDAPICEDRLYVRNAVSGTYTNLERITNVLRDHVWGGDKIVGFVREELFKDAFIERGSTATAPPQSGGAPLASGDPRPAAVGEEFVSSAVRPEHLAIDAGPQSQYFQLGRWYPVRDSPGIFVSVMQPSAVPTALLHSFTDSVNALDAVESGALDYFVAMDLSKFDLGFELGTDHPRVGWSERVLPTVRDPRLPGPDGIGVAAPLVTNGIVSPAMVGRTALTFAGGFKREHGAFRYGALAEQHMGSHYGFIEQGAIFSKLQPGLATLIVMDDGTVRMRTWSAGDDASLQHIKHARQNGVPLIEVDGATGVSRPGPLVNRWGPGNWSGSSEEHLRTLRAGACLQEQGTARFLIYGYFSTATPSAMARLFQAYGCRYAMQLDMNALEHTYLALYIRRNDQIVVQHLVEGMSEVDRKGGEQLAPRFLSFPDDRDFFYLTRKEQP